MGSLKQKQKQSLSLGILMNPISGIEFLSLNANYLNL